MTHTLEARQIRRPFHAPRGRSAVGPAPAHWRRALSGWTVVILLLLLGAPPIIVPELSAQGSRADYDRADGFRERFSGLVRRSRIRGSWLEDGQHVWYRTEVSGERQETILVDLQAGRRRVAWDNEALAAALSDATAEEVSAEELDCEIQKIEADAVVIRWKEKSWRWRDEQRELEPLDEVTTADRSGPDRSSQDDTNGNKDGDNDGNTNVDNEGDTNRRRNRGARAGRGANANGAATEIRFLEPPGQTYWNLRSRSDEVSPDGHWEAQLRDGQIVLRNRHTDERIELTQDGDSENPYQNEFYWSPDSSRLIALRRRAVTDRKVYLIDSAPDDQQQPKLLDYDYPKPGDELPTELPHLFDVAQRRAIPLDQTFFDQPYEVRYYRWETDSHHFTCLINQRGHQALRLVRFDATTGEAGALVDEISPTFIDYAHKTYLAFLEETDELIWMSERSGWNHLYLMDSRTGQVKRPLTQGQWVVRGVEFLDRQRRELWLWVAGIYPEQDPYYVHLARINLDDPVLVPLTDGNGTHSVSISPDRRHLIDRYARVDQPPVFELRDARDGTLICELERADWSPLLEAGWQIPERFVAAGRDGVTPIYGVIFRPTTFDPEQRYPVIEKIYAGPHGSHVPKDFSTYHSAQAMAELGFVVVQIDGMGTSHRSKAFHDVCWRNLADAGFPDRRLWITAAAEAYPQLDLSRIGIYGGSAGGQNAMRALLDHHDFYHVSVADCGCHDNRMDKIWWNELWMGWPVGPHYAESSNVEHADRLEGKLLLIVGELDRNVDPASTMQVVDALIRADKDFDLLVMPGTGHGAAGTPYGTRRMRDYFVRHLLHREPRWEPTEDPQ